MTSQKYMNPYLAGFLLGLVLLATIYVTGRGLGASGAVKSVVLSTVVSVAPEHTASTPFIKTYGDEHPDGPLKDWLVFEVIGVIIGAFFSGVISNRVGIKLERGPNITNQTRIIAAIIGGALFGLGSQLGRGCTSGAALSGMAVMSFGGIITMLAIFGSGYAFAYFFRKLWLK
jgi:uncharacterized membrane protein YedE/YeeE